MSEDTVLGIESIDQILEKIKKAINSDPVDGNAGEKHSDLI